MYASAQRGLVQRPDRPDLKLVRNITVKSEGIIDSIVCFFCVCVSVENSAVAELLNTPSYPRMEWVHDI